jgi:hypothetical protein
MLLKPFIFSSEAVLGGDFVHVGSPTCPWAPQLC